jgi:hypothetical protein
LTGAGSDARYKIKFDTDDAVQQDLRLADVFDLPLAGSTVLGWYDGQFYDATLLEINFPA